MLQTAAMDRPFHTPFFEELHRNVLAAGGFFNAHLHLDRAGTLNDALALLDAPGRALSSLSLGGKHALIPRLHDSACYDPDILEERIGRHVEAMIALGTTRADTFIDVTDDRVGLDALDAALRVRGRLAGRIDLRVGAYSPLGFRDDEPRRLELLEEGLRRADFLGALPERDDRADYPEHIGFPESVRRMLLLSAESGKRVHIHVDQRNIAGEAGSETVLRLVRELGLETAEGREPRVWLVHAISPSAYPEKRFLSLIRGLAACGIGVVTCPSAAISMRQVRPCHAPTHNSIARVLEMLDAGVHVRVGSDNICDITSPAGTPDLMDELFLLANALRFYDSQILALLGAGRRLGSFELGLVRAHLAADRRETRKAAARFRHPRKPRR